MPRDVMEPLLEMRGIHRSFGSVQANRGIDLQLRSGEILGLLGENGSGKSTLMKVLFGLIKPDSGEIRFRGTPLRNHNPRAVMRAGIGMIHQHFMLVEAMSVVENVMLGWEGARGFAGQVLRGRETAGRIAEISARYGLELDPHAIVDTLSLGQRQRIEIVKALLSGAELLVLDEPTSNLSPVEVAGLIDVLKTIRREGKSIIFISHKLEEVLSLCARVLVLRAGAVAGEVPVSTVDRDTLGRMIVGDDIATDLPVRRDVAPGKDSLIVDGLHAAHQSSSERIEDVSFALRGGQILGVAGIDGNGQRVLTDALAGLVPVAGGYIVFEGEEITALPVAARARRGIAYMPADRGGTSLVQTMTIAENLILREAGSPLFSRYGILRQQPIRAFARERIAAFKVRTTDELAPVRTLSGGNQQKLVVSRELRRQPRLLIAHQPTWGLDPGAARAVMDHIVEAADKGAAVVFISSELEEILAIADRIGVLFRGRLIADLSRSQATPALIGRLMSGDISARPLAGAAA